MSPLFSFITSCLAFIISSFTLWLTFLHKGRILMTQPTVVFFGPDDHEKNKVYLRTLLYSTSKKGLILESLYVALHRNESKQNFNIWVYGEKLDLKRGSGLFIPQDGVAFNHHFLLPADGANFKFVAGNYKLIVFAQLVGEHAPRQLMTINLSINESQANELTKPDAGIYFDWGPDQRSYHPHIDIKSDRRQVKI